MCLAQGHNAVARVRLEPATPRSRVKHSTTEPLRSHYVRLLAVSENAHFSRTTLYILIKFCMHTHVNIVKPLACVKVFLDGQGFAKDRSGWLWSVSVNAHNS